jgi:hypothetical protein
LDFVDYIIRDTMAIEVKSAVMPEARHLKGLIALADEGAFHYRILVCLMGVK